MTYTSACFTATPSRKLAVIQGQTFGFFLLVFFLLQLYTRKLFIHSYYTYMLSDSSSDYIYIYLFSSDLNILNVFY